MRFHRERFNDKRANSKIRFEDVAWPEQIFKRRRKKEVDRYISTLFESISDIWGNINGFTLSALVHNVHQSSKTQHNLENLQFHFGDLIADWFLH